MLHTLRRALPLLAAVAVLVLPSCRTTADGELVPDWPAVALELDLTAADLRDASTLLSDEELASNLQTVAGLLEQAAASINEGGPPASTVEVLQRALELADALVDKLPEESQSDARAVLLIAKASLRRVVAYTKPPATVEAGE